MRRWVFKHYWWIALLALFVGIVLCVCFGGEQRIAASGAVVAAVLGFCYFVQQQKLAETQLFYELFTGFNARYDGLNEDLKRITDENIPAVSLLPEDEALIVDYFNLCAEECLFYQEGFIHQKAWQALCRGMLGYLRRHPFKDIWNEEVKSDSFYGLTLEVIEKGANLTGRG